MIGLSNPRCAEVQRSTFQPLLHRNGPRVARVHLGTVAARYVISPEAESVRALGAALVVEVMPGPDTLLMKELGR